MGLMETVAILVGPVGAKRQFEAIRPPKTNSYESILGLEFQ